MPVPFFTDGPQPCRSRIACTPRPHHGPAKAERVRELSGCEELGGALNRSVSDVPTACGLTGVDVADSGTGDVAKLGARFPGANFV
jgi:hypothetical protein